MIYSKIIGGLGNQMFQYSIGKKISLLNEVEHRLDISQMKSYSLRNYSLGKLKISSKVEEHNELVNYQVPKLLKLVARKIYPHNFLNKGIYFEKEEFKFDKDVLCLKDAYLEGYWQSFRYFDDIREVLLKEFVLKSKFDKENRITLENINSCNSVSIHVRRGDYQKNKLNQKLYDVFGIEYYNRAIEYMLLRIKNPHFFIFSDDIDWVSENLFIDNSSIVDVNSSNNFENDLFLMKECKHNIIANSTFSWWAAYLNENSSRIVIAPNRWMSTFSDLDDLYPSNWIKL